MTSSTHAALLTAGTILFSSYLASANTLLDDDFDNNDLATNSGIGGGFVMQTNGVNTDGSVAETGTIARITEGNGSNTTGIRSINTFDLSDSGLTYTVTWEVSGWDLEDTTGTVRRLLFALQTNDSFPFAGDNEESRIIVDLDAEADRAYLRYQNRSGGTNNNFTTADFSVGAFATDTDGFTATMTLDSSGFSFTTTGLDATTQVNISDTWANLLDDDDPGTSADFATVLGTDGPMHVAIYNQNIRTTGQVLDIDRISMADSITSSLPIVLKISPNGANYDFEWNSQEGKVYRLVSSTDLAAAISTWATYNDGVTTYDSIAPSGTGTNTLMNVIPIGTRRFFAVIED
ncbi:hypothetical protein HAHE_32740 [Haloferula helveola]|uniref:VCBS repeat-containing protein n=1 Tax=Haloferula helveola TaxID=490095 RepID=A0ABN6H6S7_9BACT|nr:hypothetical protein HAHE_32740 [Haloferula helveola]